MEGWVRERAAGRKRGPAREALLVAYQPLVTEIAEQTGRRVGRDADDLVSYGAMGLLSAADTYDPGRGSWHSYAAHRISFTIKDHLRSAAETPRTVLDARRALGAAVDAQRARLHREPTDIEVAGELGVSVERVQEMRRQVAGVTLLNDDGWDEVASLAATGSHEDVVVEEAGVVEDRIRARLVEAIETIRDPQDRLVLALYYWQGRTMRDIAETLGVSVASVAKIHSRALVSLRAVLP